MFGIKLKKFGFPYVEQDKEVYAPLKTGDGSSSPSKHEFNEKVDFIRPMTKQPSQILNWSIILLLFITNILTVIGFAYTKRMLEHDEAANEYMPKSAGEL